MNKDILRRPFPPELIKQREGQYGKMLSYVETHSVIERLNEGCDAWSFEVVEHRILDAEVVVVGRLIADGILKMAFGGSPITIDSNGNALSLADDLKAAASDALKKAASLLGVGLELYASKGATAEHPRALPPARAGRSPAGPAASGAPPDAATEKQIAAIQGICNRKRLSRRQVTDIIAERTGKRSLNQLTRREASSLISALGELNGAHA
jgi:hypothetical protein